MSCPVIRVTAAILFFTGASALPNVHPAVAQLPAHLHPPSEFGLRDSLTITSHVSISLPPGQENLVTPPSEAESRTFGLARNIVVHAWNTDSVPNLRVRYQSGGGITTRPSNFDLASGLANRDFEVDCASRSIRTPGEGVLASAAQEVILAECDAFADALYRESLLASITQDDTTTLDSAAASRLLPSALEQLGIVEIALWGVPPLVAGDQAFGVEATIKRELGGQVFRSTYLGSLTRSAEGSVQFRLDGESRTSVDLEQGQSLTITEQVRVGYAQWYRLPRARSPR